MKASFSRLAESLNCDRQHGMALLSRVALCTAFSSGGTRGLKLCRYERAGLESGQVGRRGERYGVLRAFALAGKLACEQFAGPNSLDLGLPVVTIAHI